MIAEQENFLLPPFSSLVTDGTPSSCDADTALLKLPSPAAFSSVSSSSSLSSSLSSSSSSSSSSSFFALSALLPPSTSPQATTKLSSTEPATTQTQTQQQQHHDVEIEQAAHTHAHAHARTHTFASLAYDFGNLPPEYISSIIATGLSTADSLAKNKLLGKTTKRSPPHRPHFKVNHSHANIVPEEHGSPSAALTPHPVSPKSSSIDEPSKSFDAEITEITPKCSKTRPEIKPSFRAFNCPHCDYKAKQKQHLANHVRTHTGEKPYSCPHCDYKATQKQHLRVHIRTHTGEKPFHCTQCEYETADQAALVKHLRIHTGERPYACPHCEYRATLKVHLTTHLRTHSGEKPFKCHLCNYSSAQNVGLRKHLENFHGVSHSEESEKTSSDSDNSSSSANTKLEKLLEAAAEM